MSAASDWDVRGGTRSGVWRLDVRTDSGAASFADVVAGWQGDADLRERFAAALAGAPYDAFCWESPPLTMGSRDEPFECVLVDSPALSALPSDPTPFEGVFDALGPGERIATFPNLGGDAVLVAPAPAPGEPPYPHLAAFVRSAPPERVHALWRAVGEAVYERIGARPLWVSTAGLGVGWVHVRLDTRPKYYRYAPYRRAP
jgi:hypothetical protein